MPTIVDSLFLELGIDVSKFSKDQQTALAKISQFESQAKRSAGKSADSIKTVGAAFRDLANDSRVGSSAAGIDNLATKLKNLGMSMQVSGGVGTPLGGMAKGLGMLLSPAALGAAAIGLLGKSVWDLNKNETALFATLKRNSELTGTSATNLWSLGLAAKTVGGDPEAVQAAIVQRDTALAGMSIGVGSAVPQMIGMARLARFGARFNKGGFGQGVDEESLFKAVQAFYKKNGRAKTVAMTQGYGLMSADETDLAMNPGGWEEYQKVQAQTKAMKTGGGFEEVVRNSLKSQAGLGEKDIAGAMAAETAYGGIQQPMQTIVGLLTNIYAVITAIFNFIAHPIDAASKAIDYLTQPNPIRGNTMAHAMQALMGSGLSKDDAASIVGNMAQESSMNPLARNGSHVGLGQWDKARQADFAKRYGYQMGSSAVSEDKQFDDQTSFFVDELKTTQREAASAQAKARDLLGKTSAIMNLDERPGDSSLGQRLSYAQYAARIADAAGMVSAANNRSAPVQHTVTSETHIGEVNVHTPATDPKSHVNAVADGLANHPLLNFDAQGTVSLATRGMTG